jgi:hypothetical protein
VTRRLRAALAGLLTGVLVAACANIPPESQPEVVPGEKPVQPQQAPTEPASGIDALTVVRDFVRASTSPGPNNAAARVYLDDDARRTWRPANSLSVIEDTFGTVYDTSTPDYDPNDRIVTVRGFNVGTLGADKAFIPASRPYEQSVHVHLQVDGQWRITDPPANLAVTESDFSANYFGVPVYFYSDDTGAFVPDLRYVVAKPQSGLPGRVVDCLLSGPSDGLSGAVRSLLGDQAAIETNVRVADDGALVVPLTGLGGQSDDLKRLIVAQIVLSLRLVTTSRIRLLNDGVPLVADHDTWLPSDLPSYDSALSPSSELQGMVVVDGRVRSLGNGDPIQGAAGAGAYDVESAAQSLDGKRLALVEKAGDGVRLRVGDVGRDAPIVDGFAGRSLTRPTWQTAPPGGGASGEVWTVLDGQNVVRVLADPNGRWSPLTVNVSELAGLGTVTALRLSRDGARAALVMGGQAVVASVVRTPGSVRLTSPRVLRSGELTNVVDIDWENQDTLVVATSSPSLPLARVPVDGLRMDTFNSSNLTAPVHAVTAAPNRPVMVADAGGLWTASDVGEVWRPFPHTFVGANPFYPG